MKDNEYFVIFGGGGIRGICYCGAYKALLESNIKLTGYAGSSIGAVFAALIAIGYKYDEVYEILAKTGFEMFIDINIDFKKDLAISKGKIFYDWIKEQLEKKYYGEIYEKDKMPPVKFCDIKNKLVIYSVDLTHLKFKEFSCEKTPDFEIAQAIRASVSMPGLFTPLEYEDSLIVDGDLLKSTPLWRVSNTIKNLDERILEFRLEDNETPKKTDSSLGYLNRVYNAISGFATDYIIDLYKEKDKFDYIKINTPDVSVVDFLMPKEKKQELFDIGYQSTKKYLLEFLPEKRKRINQKYKELLKLLIKFQKEFSKTNIINSYLYLCEIFVYLCEQKQYMDSKIYCQILDFKENYTKNFKKINFFGIKSAISSKKEAISKQLININKSVAEKISC